MTEDGGRLLYFVGSPFARMARVLLREWRLPITEEELEFPATAALVAVNPLGQVPVLELGAERVFPTLMVLERLWRLAGAPSDAYAPEGERQTLLTILQAGDALAAALYQDWAGLRPVGRNHVGYDPGERNRARVEAVLDWLDEGRLRDGLTLPGVALACLVLWADARGGLDWRRRRSLDALVGSLEERASFRRTRPHPWSPGAESRPQLDAGAA